MKLASPFLTGHCDRTDAHAPHDPCGGLVPDDWIRVPCAGPGCGNGVWLPPAATVEAQETERELKGICSTECAEAVMALATPGSVYKEVPEVGND